MSQEIPMNEQAQPETINQALLAAMDAYARRTCFWEKRGQRFQATSYWRFRALTFRLASFFREHGVSDGRRVAIIAEKSVEWMVAYVACLLTGGIAAPIRHLRPPDQILSRLLDAGADLVVAQNERQLQAIALAGDGLLGVGTVITIEESKQAVHPATISLSSILTEAISAPEEKAIRAAAERISPATFAAIYYTSGSAEGPLGAVFDQSQCLKSLQSMKSWFSLDDDDVAFTTPLPWSYLPNLNASLYYFLSGAPNALTQTRETAFEDLQEISPTVTLTNPNAFEFIYEDAINEMSQLPEVSREVFDWALSIGREYRAAGPEVPPELSQAYTRADLTFFSRIRGKLGGRLRRFYSVGAPLAGPDIEFAEAVGLLPLNVYALTGAGGFPAASRPDARRDGSCGQTVAGYEIRIAEDGEVLVRGNTVMREYWQNPAATARALDEEGWLHTGDFGRLDEDNFLYLTGHRLPRLALSTGRKVQAEAIEAALSESPFIDQAVILGEGRSYISAIIVPDLEALGRHFQVDEPDGEMTNPTEVDTALKWFWPPDIDDGQPMTTGVHPTLKRLLDKVVADVNQTLDQWEQIQAYCLLDQANSKAAYDLAAYREAGPHVAADRFAPLLKAIYPMRPGVDDKKMTHVQVSPERLRDLLEKESILDAWLADAGIQFLFDLAISKQIDVPCMVHISDTAVSIAQMESEEKPLSTALIVGDPRRIARVLPPSQLQLLRHDHIRRMRKIMVTMARMVDGIVLGYVIDKYGFVRAVHRLTAVKVQQISSFLGPQFLRHAVISKECEAVVFFVPTGGRQVRVFADGQMVGRYANGDWSPDDLTIVDRVIKELATEKAYDSSILHRILRCAFQMSENNQGAIFMVGDANRILEQSDTAEISSFAAIVGIDIAHLTDEELINFAKQDGATVIDVEGQLRGCMVLLRPNASTQAEIGPGKGARHSSAAKMSAEAECLAITISQDGPITIYDDGRRILSL
jgi:long-chain acyl-CoA synthetase